MLDTLTYANKLKKAGFTEEQAEAIALGATENLATKQDLKHEIQLVKKDIKELELKFEGRFALIQWMLGVVIAGILSLVVKTFFA